MTLSAFMSTSTSFPLHSLHLLTFFVAFLLQVRTGDRIEVSSTNFMTPSAFIFLYENQLFLTFRQRNVAVWNFRGVPKFACTMHFYVFIRPAIETIT
jgi:hypothetical protein